MAYRTYETKRGHALLYTQEPLSVPVLTLENYDKWYELYLVMPDGSVQEVPVEVVEVVMDTHPQGLWVDHLYHPQLLYRLAEHINAELDDQALEVAIGRWVLEGPGQDDVAHELGFAHPHAKRY